MSLVFIYVLDFKILLAAL